MSLEALWQKDHFTFGMDLFEANADYESLCYFLIQAPQIQSSPFLKNSKSSLLSLNRLSTSIGFLFSDSLLWPPPLGLDSLWPQCDRSRTKALCFDLRWNPHRSYCTSARDPNQIFHNTGNGKETMKVQYGGWGIKRFSVPRSINLFVGFLSWKY